MGNDIYILWLRCPELTICDNLLFVLMLDPEKEPETRKDILIVSSNPGVFRPSDVLFTVRRHNCGLMDSLWPRYTISGDLFHVLQWPSDCIGSQPTSWGTGEDFTLKQFSHGIVMVILDVPQEFDIQIH